MPTTAVELISGLVLAESPLGHVYGVPALPVWPAWLHRTKTSDAFVATNRARFSLTPDPVPVAPQTPAHMVYTVAPAFCRVNDERGFVTPYYVPTAADRSWTWLSVQKRHTGSIPNPIMGLKRAPSTTPALVGFSVDSIGAGSALDARCQFTHWDGADIGSVTVQTATLVDAVWTTDVWSAVVTKFDHTANAVTMLRPENSDTVTEALPSGRVLYRDGWAANPIRFAGNQFSTAISTSLDVALFAGWDSAIPNDLMRGTIWPRLRAWLAADGITV